MIFTYVYQNSSRTHPLQLQFGDTLAVAYIRLCPPLPQNGIVGFAFRTQHLASDSLDWPSGRTSDSQDYLSQEMSICVQEMLHSGYMIVCWEWTALTYLIVPTQYVGCYWFEHFVCDLITDSCKCLPRIALLYWLELIQHVALFIIWDVLILIRVWFPCTLHTWLIMCSAASAWLVAWPCGRASVNWIFSIIDSSNW